MPRGLPEPPTRAHLHAQLSDTRIAGDVETPRESNIRHYRRLAEGDPYYELGLVFDRAWSFADILALMAERVGVDPDPRHVMGPDTIDPDLTIDAVERMAKRVAGAADRRERVLLATGHPGGMLPVYTALAGALRDRGCPLLTPAAGWAYPAAAYADRSSEPGGGHLTYRDDVAMICDRIGPRHTHAPEPMRAMLDDLAAAGEAPPGFVIADHGLAGAAGAAGIETVAFADCNDPALFLGEDEGRVAVTVPLDDHVNPRHYAPLTAYLLDLAGLLEG